MVKIDEALPKAELTEEQKNDQMMLEIGYNLFKRRIKDIAYYLKEHDINIFKAIEEVKNKKSLLSKSNRDILESIKPEILSQWMDKFNKV